MSYSIEQLKTILEVKEDEHTEFKEAKNRYDFEELVKYCVALANEGGGQMILGVTNSRPRTIVGSLAFDNLERTKAGLIERLYLRIEAEELFHPDGRVIIFIVPPHPIGVPIEYKGAYWMRGGEDLVPMTPDMLKRIFAEAGTDFTAEICAKATIDDLMADAIDDFRKRWVKKSGNDYISKLATTDLLVDAELMVENHITYAALILFGTRRSLGQYLAQAEIILEYRSTDAAGPAQWRGEFRQGFFTYYDSLWEKINLRNDKQHFQDGLFMVEISTFNEGAVREALLNAVSHREYRHPGSIYIRQFPRRVEMVSPGGFPPGISPKNILDRQFPRNRLLAVSLAKCGLVERAGQGANRIFESCILEGKPLPDFNGTDEHQVSLTLHGNIQNPQFLQFLEKIGHEQLATYGTHDLLILNLIYWNRPIPEECKSRIPILIEKGILERQSRGRFILSRKFHSFIGQKGVYTRRKGLDKSTNKELLLKHISDNAHEGSKMGDFLQVLPGHNRNQIHTLLGDLRQEGKIHSIGIKKAAKWYLNIKGD
jgi:ATP-dependent DNA helicase RecG